MGLKDHPWLRKALEVGWCRLACLQGDMTRTQKDSQETAKGTQQSRSAHLVKINILANHFCHTYAGAYMVFLAKMPVIC